MCKKKGNANPWAVVDVVTLKECKENKFKRERTYANYYKVSFFTSRNKQALRHYLKIGLLHVCDVDRRGENPGSK